MSEKLDSEPCPICQGNGTCGRMLKGVLMIVIECEVCGGEGHLPILDEAAWEDAKDRSRV
jgi:DnaJ-class molecular chaperone